MIAPVSLFSIALTFGWLSLFAVGGAAAAIPGLLLLVLSDGWELPDEVQD